MKRFLILFAAPLLVLIGLGSPAQATNDRLWSQQYGPQQISAPTAWSKARGAGVTVAVIDSGVDLQHPDLKGKIVAGCPGSNCYDFGDSDNNPDDDSTAKDGGGKQVRGHGTHVAGIVAAATDNGEGIAGVAPDAKIMPIKIFGNNGSLTGVVTDIPDAVSFAVSHGAKVLNLSLGDFNLAGLIGPIQNACNDAFDKGALCIVSSGNDGRGKPSGYDRSFKALIVTANDKAGEQSSFGQNADTQWSVSAPGVGIVSSVPVEDGSYGNKSGTSMSAPHAAGVAALLAGQGLSNRQIALKMIDTASPMRDSGQSGYGIINAAAAVGASPPPAGSPAARTGGVAGGAAASSGSKSSGKTSGGSTGSGSTNATQPGGALAPGEQGGGDDFTSGFADSQTTADLDGQAAGASKKDSSVSGDAVAKTVAGLLLLAVASSTFGAWRRRPV